MGKEFKQNENDKQTYRISAICNTLTSYAKDYINQDKKQISNHESRIRNAVLVDAINYLGIINGCEFDLCTKNLYSGKKYPKKVDGFYLLSFMTNYYANYIFNQDMVESVLINCYTNSCREQFNQNDGALVLIDFINFISKKNGFDKVFTLKELYEKAQIKKHNEQLEQLKSFLIKAGMYYERMQNGEDVNSIYENIRIACNLKCVTQDGRYYYSSELAQEYGRKEMFIWDKNIAENEICALAYAYAKMYNNQVSNISIINQKIKEMSKR